jgi:hypothetical protein
VTASVADIKEVLDVCLAADIPALLDRQESCGEHGHPCAPKIDLCVRPDDLPKVMALLHARWQNMLTQEGTLDECEVDPATGDDPPCPACGVAAPLVDGACKECGLQLE